MPKEIKIARPPITNPYTPHSPYTRVYRCNSGRYDKKPDEKEGWRIGFQWNERGNSTEFFIICNSLEVQKKAYEQIRYHYMSEEDRALLSYKTSSDYMDIKYPGINWDIRLHSSERKSIENQMDRLSTHFITDKITIEPRRATGCMYCSYSDEGKVKIQIIGASDKSKETLRNLGCFNEVDKGTIIPTSDCYDLCETWIKEYDSSHEKYQKAIEEKLAS